MRWSTSEPGCLGPAHGCKSCACLQPWPTVAGSRRTSSLPEPLSTASSHRSLVSLKTCSLRGASSSSSVLKVADLCGSSPCSLPSFRTEKHSVVCGHRFGASPHWRDLKRGHGPRSVWTHLLSCTPISGEAHQPSLPSLGAPGPVLLLDQLPRFLSPSPAPSAAIPDPNISLVFLSSYH